MSLRSPSWRNSSDRIRRLVVGAGLASSAAIGCASGAPAGPANALPSQSGADQSRSPLLALVDLEEILGNDAHELSGTYYDANTRALYALSDRSRSLVCLRVSSDHRSLSPCEKIQLVGSQTTEWDGEALTRKGDEFYVITNETNSQVERFDSAGHFRGQVSLRPAIYDRVLRNKGLESLTISPTGTCLFAANEFALQGDPKGQRSGATVRILRRNMETGVDAACAYRTEPYRGDFGVSELLALSDTELLVLERDYVQNEGNTVRLFYVDLGDANFGQAGACGPEVLSESPLSSSVPVVAKQPVLDFSTLPSRGVHHPGTQRNNLLDNYEALALGPRREDGRYVLFVTSDDNGNSQQVARMLILSLRIPGAASARTRLWGSSVDRVEHAN